MNKDRPFCIKQGMLSRDLFGNVELGTFGQVERQRTIKAKMMLFFSLFFFFFLVKIIFHTFQIPDDLSGYPLSMFCVPHHYLDDLESILIPRGLIDDRFDISVSFLVCPRKQCFGGNTQVSAQPIILKVRQED